MTAYEVEGDSPTPRWALRLRAAAAVVVLLPAVAFTWAGRSVPRWVLVGLVGLLLLSAVFFGVRTTAAALWSAARAVMPGRSTAVDGTGHLDLVLEGDPAALADIGGPSPVNPFQGAGGVRRAAEPTDDVKRAPLDELAERVTDRWEEAAKWANLTHPHHPEVIAPAVGPAQDNGLGGVVLLVDPDPARRAARDLGTASSVYKLTRVFGADSVHVRRSGRLAEVHVYDGQPLAGATAPDWLYGHPVTGEEVPIGPTATAGAAMLPLRLSVRHTSLTDGGKTNAQLAFELSLALSKVPSAAIVLDNKSAPGGRGSELLPVQPGALFYRSRTDQVWECIQATQAILGERLEGVGGREYLPIDGRRPLVTFLVAEGLDVLRSRPPELPIEVLPGGTKAAALQRAWSRYTGGQLDGRPTNEVWRAFLVDRFGEVVRLGRLVNVRLSWAGQLGQVQVMPTVLRSAFPASWAGRLPQDSDVEPALGVPHQQAPCHRIPRWQKGAGYVAVGDVTPEFHRPVLVDDDATTELLVPHLQRYLPDRPRLRVVGGTTLEEEA
jgi:hypothetical protein